METLADRLKRLREERGLKQLDVATMLNVKPNTYCRYENGKRTPPPEVIAKLAEIFGVSTDYLLGCAQQQVPQVPEEASCAIRGFMSIPVYGVIRAGDPIYADQNIIGYTAVPEDELSPGNYFALRVEGDSMKDVGIFNGSVVIVRKQPVVDNGKIAVVLLRDTGEATVKRFYSRNGTVILKPENPDYGLQIYRSNEVMVLGEVVRVILKPR